MANYGLEEKGVAVLHRTDFNFVDVAENLPIRYGGWPLPIIDAASYEPVGSEYGIGGLMEPFYQLLSGKAYDIALRSLAEQQNAVTEGTEEEKRYRRKIIL